MTVEPSGAEVVGQRTILPGQRIDELHAPAIAVAARAGQFVQLLLVDDEGWLTRRPCPISTVDPGSGVISVHHDLGIDGFGAAPLRRLRPGDHVGLAGPLGRPFELDARSRHLLLIAAGPAIAAIRLLLDEALGDGRQVTMLFGARSARDVYPSTLLPDEVEYVVATEDGSLGHSGTVPDLVPAYEAWADQAFAAGDQALLARLAALAAGRRQRMGVAKLGRKRGGGRPDPPGSPAARRKAFLQVAVGHALSCAAATCLGCVVQAAGGGYVRPCREGPVFAAEELDWETQA